MSFIKGQRWISQSEPELGLGVVVRAAEGRVELRFSAAAETRTYAMENAPLKRIRFRPGDKIAAGEHERLTVESVHDEGGLLVYNAKGLQIPETELSDRISLQGPEDRLFAGRFGEPHEFALRWRTLSLLHRLRKSPIRGFVGGRIDLIPHQLYIADNVANRHAPRVMLSDEVGLGKTIEACLILHRLLLSGRADRILILVPESLVHQWFLEMLRRFNVRLSIFDEERCAAIEAADPEANPFLDDQLILASSSLLAENPRRAGQAAEAGWDMLVVDEAHHLQWSSDAPSRDYSMVEAISHRAEGLLLLTATPEQLGIESHFARLRLLDPDRYQDLAVFKAEVADYLRTAGLVTKISAGGTLSEEEIAILQEFAGMTSEMAVRLRQTTAENNEARASLVDDLLDLHGPGRVLFRNTRAAMTGFPRRIAELARIDAEPHWLDRLSTEFAVDAGDTSLVPAADLAQDPRILWLVQLLQDLGGEKVLLICRSLDKAEAIDEALRRHLNLKMAVFHESLTLIQRDRHAAWFAEPDGARLLICSEIGSEGRNFQFAHHLVTFDLPLNPELLEQRIGRLDRIGQKQNIHIHVPFVAHSPQEVLARWYHEGLNAFETNVEGGNELLQRFGRRIHDVALEFPVADRNAAEEELATLLKETKAARDEIRQLLEQGRDRLLEMNSYRPAPATRIIEQIRAADREGELEEYMLDVFDHYGVHVEELAPHTWQLNPQGVITDAFPALPEAGMIATFDRARAVSREDIGFLTGDHPMVTGAMELLLGSETGNCAFAVLPAPGERTLLLELIYVLEALAAPRLHADRFLPATPIRLVVNHQPAEVTPKHSGAAFEEALRKGSPYKLIENAEITRRMLPSMIEHASRTAEEKAKQHRAAASQEMSRLLDHEIDRLAKLMRVNNHIRPQELELARAHRAELEDVIRDSRLRLDALRLIWKGPPEALEKRDR